mgnify:FL=1
MKKYLVINAGSSSLKFALYDVDNMDNYIELANGYIEKIGSEDSFYTIKTTAGKIKKEEYVKDHVGAVKIMLKELVDNNFIKDFSEIAGIGHRILHGGEYYQESVIIDEEVIKNVDSLAPLGPLHIPGSLNVIHEISEIMPDVEQVGVFDTAFHQTMPEVNYLYAVPYEWYSKYGVRKYGFHGTSHKYITEEMMKIMNKEDINLIICHLGSGASISCIRNGICYNTSMGLTPLDGLVMGTRCGNIDASVVDYVSFEEGKTSEEITMDLNRESGLFGICGKSDFRDILKLCEAGDKKAYLALDMFVSSVTNYIAEYYFQLRGKVDGIIFTAGCGENVMSVRESIIDHIKDIMGIELDKEMNNKIASYLPDKMGMITTKESKIPVYVIPTNEEYMILKDTYNLVNKKENVKIKKYTK